MILKRNFNPVSVFRYVRREFLFSMFASLLAYLLGSQFENGNLLPFSVAAILGSALAIFIAFRNNSSYSRWWEARTLWGGIVNSSRVFARLIITFTDSHSHQENYQKERSEQFKKEMVYKIIAWVHALRIHLRKQGNWESLAPLLSQDEYKELLRAQHKPNYLHLISGKQIYQAMSSGILGGFDSFQMEGQMLALANYQGGCERIKNTPMLRQYDYFTRVFLYTFMALLPMALSGDFHRIGAAYLLIPVSIVISMVFAIIGKVGEVNEDPFENRITDVPLNAICNTIERDLREMLGEKNLPLPAEPENGFLY